MGAVVLELHCIDPQVEHGIWCDDCLLPSAVKIPMVAVDALTLRPALRVTFTVCTECGGQNYE